ncbi:MAG: DEAD/DEAH box helicase family protein, partial [Oscillospiraceae bacterium]|nr:DEAD/DEAH box helicase family protein [Oscillospiraceae bacterium]
AKYGDLTSGKTNKLFSRDSDCAIVQSLEDINDNTNEHTKAAIFTERTVVPQTEITEAATLEDALQYSLDRKGKIDLIYMAELLKDVYQGDNVAGTIRDELIDKGYAFMDPDKIIAGEPYTGIVDSVEYLSGNVRQKLNTAMEYAENHPEYQRNVEALTKVIPEDIKIDEITVQMGCSWIDAEDYTKFLNHLSGRSAYSRFGEVSYSALTGEFTVTNSRARTGFNVNESQTYGTQNFSLYALAEKILNQRRIAVNIQVPNPKDPSKNVTRTDVKATKIANDVAKKIKQEFKKWIFADEARREKYERRYNNIFNSLVGRSYDGSKLTFPGLKSDFMLRPHQKNCVARTIYGGNTLAAHVVGAGKSAVIITSVMKKKELGLINKACVVVPKPLTEQTAAEWRKMYPGARLLTVTAADLNKEDKRKIFTAKVATGSYNAVIMSQEQFAKLQMSDEYRAEYIQKEIDELEENLREAKGQNGSRYSVKDIETKKKDLQNRLIKVTAPKSKTTEKDDLLDFENLGFDYLVVDEAHAYKNAFVITKMSDVAGVTTKPSDRAEDMQMKTDYFNEKFGQGHILFATGTPVSNSMTELYVMTRYLRPDLLKAQGIDRFDDWASTFGQVVTKNQQTSSGTLKLKTKFASFANLPELMAMYKEFADVQSAEKLNLPRPRLKDDKVQIIKAPATKEQKAYVKELADRALAYESGLVDSTKDNHLVITGEARLVGLGNMVLKSLYEKREKELPEDFIIEKNSKVDLCVEKVAELYNKTNETKGVQ